MRKKKLMTVFQTNFSGTCKARRHRKKIKHDQNIYNERKKIHKRDTHAFEWKLLC